jgi:hypothetical protein
MKKRTIILFFGLSMAALACSKKESIEPEPAANCYAATSAEFQKAYDALIADPQNRVKCENALKVAGKFLNCPGASAAEKQEYQELIDSKPCD